MQLIEHLQDDCCHIIITELVVGLDLCKLIELRQFDERLCRMIFKKICDAVSVMHGGGVVHRDLHMRNIMISFPGIEPTEEQMKNPA